MGSGFAAGVKEEITQEMFAKLVSKDVEDLEKPIKAKAKLDKFATFKQIREAAKNQGKYEELAAADDKVNECYADANKLLLSECYNDQEESIANWDEKLPVPPRFNRILSIILKQNPDVITLQELDHHYDFMLPQLQKMGYDGIFQPKHISKGAEFNGGYPDGVAIFWNTERIQKIGENPVFSGSLSQYKKVNKEG